MRNASSTTTNSTANKMTGNATMVIRRSPIAMALAGIFGGGVALAANTITPIGSTTLVTPNNAGTATDITTSLIRNATGVNAFSKFVVDSGQLVNLHIPAGATQLLNLVNDKIIIDGTVNSLVSNKVGGKLIFASPNGMLVGAAGVLNVGSLVVRAPNQTSFDAAGKDLAGSGAMADLIAGNGTYGRADAGLIQVNGKIFASGGIILDAATVKMGAGGSLVASDSVALQQSVAAVNTGTLIATDLVSVNGVIEILGSNIAIGDSGRVVTPGVYDNGSIVNHGANVTLTAPSITLSGGSQILAQSKDGVLPHGTVTLLAQSEQVFDSNTAISHIKSDASANISIDGKIEAGKIDAQAKARAIYDWQEKLGLAEMAASTDVASTAGDHLLKGALGTVATALTGANIGVAKVDGSANIKLGAHADLKADGAGAAGGVLIKAETSAELSLTKRAQAPVSLNPLFSLAFVYADNQAHSTVTIENGAKIDSKGKVDILAQTNTLLNVSVTAISNESVAVLAGALTSADIEAKVEVQKGVTISADENVTIKATNLSKKLNTEALSIGVEASSTTAASLLGAAVAYTDLNTAATVNTGAQITSRNESVLVTAKNDIEENALKAKSQLVKELSNVAKTKLAATDSAALVGVLGGSVFSGLVTKLTLNLPGSGETRPSAAGALAYGENQHVATVQIADSASGDSQRSKIDAANAVYINATLIDAKPVTSAGAEVAAMPSKDGTGVGIAAAVAMNNYQHTAQAVVGKNAELSGRAVNVHAKIDMVNPSLAAFSEFFGDLISSPKDTVQDIAKIIAYPNGQTSSSSTAAANTSAVNGSVSWISFADNSDAKIDSGVQLHLKQGVPTTLVDIDENNVQRDMVLVNGVAVSSAIVVKQVFASGLIPVAMGSSSGEGNAKSLGGNVNYLAHGNHSSAVIADGVSINQAVTEQDGSVTPPVAGKEVQVKSNNDVSLGVLTWASGKGGAFGANLMFAMTDLDESSHAIIDRSAHIMANKVAIDAKENLHDYTVAGTYSNAKETGVALSVAVNSVKTDTVAAVATTANTNNQADYSAVQGIINASQVDVSARTDGEIWAGSLAAAVSENDKAPAWAPPKPESTPDTSGLGKVTGKIKGLFSKSKSAAVPESYKPDFGLSISGSSSVNDVQMGTHAYLDGAHVVASDEATSILNVQAINAARIGAVSGGVSKTKTTNAGAEGSAAVAGAFAYNDIANVTDASIHSANHLASELADKRSVLSNFHEVGVTALAGGEQFALALGVGANSSGGTGTAQQNSSGVAGSAAASVVKNTVSAVVSYATIDNDGVAASGNNLHIRALDDIFLATGAGGLTKGSSKSVGGAFTYSEISDTVTASLDHASVENYQGIAVNALTSSNIYAAALGAAWSESNGGGSGFAVSGSVVVNTIKNSVTADVKNSTINSTTSGHLDVSARDTVDPDLKFSDLIAAPASTSGVDYSGASSGVDGDDVTKPKVSDSIKGAGSSILTVAGSLSVAAGSDASSAGSLVVAYNGIKNTFAASVEDSKVDMHAGGVDVKAASNAYILDVAAGVATTTGTGKFAAAGVIAVNEIANTIYASVSGSPVGETTIDANKMTVSASDSSHIDTGTGALAVSTKSNAVGGAIAYSEISNKTEAWIDTAKLGATSSPDIEVLAKNSSGIRTITVAAGAGKENAVGIVTAVAEISNTTTASLKNVSQTGSGIHPNQDADIAVKASDNAAIQTIAVEVAAALGNAAAVGGVVAVNVIGNTTDAVVSGGQLAVADVTVDAQSAGKVQIIAVGLGVSKGNVGIAGSVISNEINSDTSARIKDGARINATNNVLVNAESDDHIDLAAGAFGASKGVGIGASVVINGITTSTVATIEGSNTVVIAQAKGNALTTNSGGFDDIGSINSADSINAYHDLDLKAKKAKAAIKGVAVNATATEYIESISVNAGVGKDAAVAANININHINGGGTKGLKGTKAYIADATVTSGVTGDASRVGDVDVRAGNLSVASGFSGALAISTGGVGVGVGFDGALMQRETRAYISGAQITADNAVRVDANAVQAVSSLAAVGAVGGKVGVGLTGSLIQFDATTEAYIQGGQVRARQLDVDADSISKAFSFAGMLAAGGQGAGGGAVAVVTSDNATKAYIAGTAVDKVKVSVDGAVNVDANAAIRVDGYAMGAALAGQLALAGSVEVNQFRNTTQATINNAIVGAESAKVGSLNVAAHNSTEIHSNAGALAIGVGTAGAGAAIVFNDLNNTTSANIIDSAVVANGAVAANADSTNQVDSYSIAGGGGLYVGFGAGVNVTLIGGKAGGNEGDKSQAARDYVNGIDLANLPENLGFSGTAAPVIAPSSLAYKTAAGISGTSTVKASAVNVLSEDRTGTYSMAGGVGVGLLGVGASVTVVKTDATVESIVGPAVSLISGDITVNAIAKDKDGKHTIEVDSWAGAGGGFALGGAVSYGEITNHVTAQLAGTVNASGAAVVTADDSSSIHLSSYGAAIGVSAAAATIFSFGEKDSTVIAQLNPDLSGKSDASMSVGSMAVTGKKSGKVEAKAIGGAVGGIGLTVTLSEAKDDSSVLAKLNDNLHLASGELSVKTDSNSSLTTNTVAGAAGYFAGSAAVASSSDSGSSTVQVGSAVVIEATGVTFKAQHQSEFKNTADASQISLAGGSGATAKGNVNTSATASIGDDAHITATSITVSAHNDVTEHIDASGNANGISGGLAAGAGMSSNNTINTTSNVTTGDRSVLQTADLVLSESVIGAGAIKLEASSKIFAADRSNVSVGGAIAGANSESTIEASTHNSVTVGTAAQIHSGNAIDIGTYDDIQISTGAYAHGYGLAGAVAGTARSVIVTDQNIEVKKDAQLFAWDDIRIATGRDANGIAQDSLRASADSQVYFDGAFNGTKPRAEAYITSNAKSIINSGASLKSVRNILLGNLAGYSAVSASGDGHYTLLGIPLTNHSADSAANHDHQFTMNGSAEAGVRHDVRFDVDANGNVTQSYAPGVTKMTYLENSAYPLIAKIETRIASLNARLNGETGSARIDTQNEIDTLTTLRNLQHTNIGGTGTVAIMELDANMAAGGNINVFSDVVTGNGSLTAHGGPSIQINNASTKYLLLNSLLIPDELGGNIDFHGATRSAADGTLRTEVTLPNVAGTIAINNTADVSGVPAPGIIMQGRIDNEGGALNVYNESGDVVQYAPVRVYRQSISAPNGTVLIDTPATGVSVNGLVEKYWTQSGGALFDLSAAAGSFGGGVSLPGGSKPKDSQGTYTGASGFSGTGAGGTAGSAHEAVMYVANAWANANGYLQWLVSTNKPDNALNRSMWLAGLNPATAGDANDHRDDFAQSAMFFATGEGFNGSQNSGSGYTSVYGGDIGVGWDRFYIPNIPLRVLSHQIDAYSPQNATGASSSEPAIKAGNAVIVNAKYIDVNGTISAGRPVEVATQIDQKNITVGSIFSTKSINLLDCLSDVVCRNSHAETAQLYDSKTGWYQYQDTDDAARKAGKVAVYFDPLSKQLVTGTIKAGGAGSITLIGQIINTNGGPNRSKLSVSNGFANVTVNNTTGKGINLGNISTGSSDDQVGVIQITDTNKINNGQVPTTWYVNMPGGSMATYTSTTARDYKTATLQSTSAAGTAAIYTPEEGSRYQWTHTANLAREFERGVSLGSWNWVASTSPYALDGVWEISASVIKDLSLKNVAFKQTISGDITPGKLDYVYVKSGYEDNRFEQTYTVVTGVNIKSVSSVKADYGIDIEFKGNNPTGKIDVNSNASINVGGRLNNENGLTSLHATGAGARIDQTGLGEVNTLSLDLKAVAGIGQVNSPFKVNLDTNPVRLATPSTISAQTAYGDITLDLHGVRDATLGQVATNGGSDVVIRSQGSLLANSANPVNVTGRNITLTSEQGSIGDSAHALTINTQASAVSGGGITGGLLQAKARNDIAITQVKGDLYVDEVISANGNVKLTALSGSLLDGKNATMVDKGDAIVDQWTNVFVPHFNEVVAAVENGNRAAYKQYLGLLSIGSLVNSVFVLNTDKLAGYQSGVQDGQTLTTAQIQEKANTQFQSLVQHLDSALVTGWQQKAEETISFGAGATEIAALTRGQNWSSDDLKYQINSAALTASTVAVPYINISGNRVELVSQAANVGNVNPAVDFDFSNGKIAYSAEQKAAILGANSAGDMIVYSKDSNNNPLYFGLKQTRDLKVEVKQALLVNAAKDVFILAKDTLPVEQVVAGGDVRLTSGAGMRNVGVDGAVAITAQNLDLQGGSGSIGAAGKAMTIKAGLLNSARSGTSTTGDVYLQALTGDINYLSLFAGNVLSLEVADGNLLTSNLDKSLSANTLLLHVKGDVRGAGTGQAIAMELGHGSQTGSVTGSIGGSAVLVNGQALNLDALTVAGAARIENSVGNMTVKQLDGGSLTLTSSGLILGDAGAVSADIHSSGKLSLTANGLGTSTGRLLVSAATFDANVSNNDAWLTFMAGQGVAGTTLTSFILNDANLDVLTQLNLNVKDIHTTSLAHNNVTLSADHAGMTLGKVSASGNLVLHSVAGNVTFSQLNADGISTSIDGKLSGEAGGELNAKTLNASATTMDLATVKVTQLAKLTASEDLVVQQLEVGSLDARARNAVMTHLLSQGNTVIDGTDNVTLANVMVGDTSHLSDLTVSAGNGLLSIGNAAVTQDVKLNAARMQLGSIIAGRDVSLVSTQGDVVFSGVLEAGQSIQTDVHASLTGSAGSVMQAATVNAVAASMDLDAVTVSGTATLSTNHTGLLGAHNLRAGQLIVNGFEDVNLGQVQVATTTQLNAGRDLQLTTLDSVQQVDIAVGRDALFDTINIDKAGLNAKVGRDMTVTTLLKSAETINIDIGRDGVFKTVNVDESNPNADLNVSAGGDLTLEKDGTAARTYLKAGGGLSLSVSGVVDGDSTVLSAKRVAVNAQSIKLLGVEAQEWIKLNARAGAVTLGYITQGDKLDAAATRNGYVDIHATGDISIGDMYSRGTTNLRSDSSVDVAKLISHKNAAIMAQDHIRLGSVIVGDVNTAANLAISAKTGSVSIASATASQDASLSADSMALGEIHAGRDLAMIATKGDLDFVRQLQAGRQLTMTVNGVLTGATGSLVQANSMNALANAIRLDQVDVAQHAELIARTGDILVDRMQVGSVKVDAQTGDALLHTVNSKGNAQITAGRNVVLTDIAVGDVTEAADLQVSALNGQIRLLDQAEVSQDAQLNAKGIDFNRLKVARNAQLTASAGIEGNSLFTGNSANLEAGDFIAIDEMTVLANVDLKTLAIPAFGASGISVNKLRTNNLQASTPSALVLNDAMIGKTAVLRAATTKANLSHAGEAALDLDVTGNPGVLAEKVDLKIDSVKGINFRNLKAIIANVATNSSNNVIQKGRISGQLSFVSPQGELWMNNVNAASLPGKLLQMYVADGAFSMAQNSNYFTTDAYVTYFNPVARPTVTNYSTLRDVASISVAGVSAERDLNRVPLGLAKADVQIAEDRMFASTAVWSSWNASKFALLDVNKVLAQDASAAGDAKEEEQWNVLIEESLASKKGAVCPGAGADVKQPSCTAL